MGAAQAGGNPGAMMQEVSMVTAYDANAIEQMSEEEILAYLVADTGPTINVRLIHSGIFFLLVNRTGFSSLARF